MTPEQVRALVEQVTRAILAADPAAGSPAPPKPRPILFLFAGAEGGLADALALVRGVATQGPVAALPCPCQTTGVEALREALLPHKAPLLDPGDEPAARAALSQAAALCVLQPTTAMIAKTARGMADTLASRLLTEALALARPAFAAGGETDPERWPATMPPAMRRGPRSLGEALAEDLRTLAAWGLQHRPSPAELHGPLVNLWRPDAAPPPPAKTTDGYAEVAPPSGFLTAEDIRRCHRDGIMAIAPAKGIRITALARDEAARLGVAIREA